MNETVNPIPTTSTESDPIGNPTIGDVHEAQPRARRLVRKRDDRMIAGVCSGIGDYVGMDANIIRLLVVLLAVLGGGAGVALYIAGWLLIPEEGAAESVGAQLLGNIRS